MQSKSKEKITIGLFINQMNGSFQTPLWNTITDSALKNNINLIIFPGKILNSSVMNDIYENQVYYLAKPSNLDGLIIHSTSLSSCIGHEIFFDFYKNFSGIPTVSLGQIIPDVSSIITNNKEATRLAIDHIISIHKKKRIAFVSGLEKSVEVRERFNGYCHELAHHNIMYNKDLIVHGDFTRSSGKKAITELLDNRKAEFDAIFLCSDDMAIGAIEELNRRGIDVPKEIIVIGFDNTLDATCFFPPLTTIEYPTEKMATTAFQLLLSLINGKKVKPVTEIKSKLIIRQSCSCPGFDIQHFNIPVKFNLKTFSDFNKKNTKYAIIHSIIMLNLVNTDHQNIIENCLLALFDAIIDDINNKNDSFLTVFNDLLIKIPEYIFKSFTWVTALDTLKDAVLSVSHNKYHKSINTIFKDALLIVEQIQNMHYTQKHLAIMQRNNKLRDLLVSSTNSTTLNELLTIIGENIIIIGIKELYFVLYDSSELCKQIHNQEEKTKYGTLRLYIKNNKYTISDDDSATFDTSKILPEKYLNNRQNTWIIRPLFIRQYKYGYIVYEVSERDETLFVTLHDIINTAFKAVILHQNKNNPGDELIDQADNSYYRSQVIKYIHKNNNINISLKKAASHLFISSRQLQKKLQEEGTSFREIVISIKIKQAKLLLKDKKIKINEITQQLGFSEPTSFTKAFKTWTGMSPSVYRQKKAF